MLNVPVNSYCKTCLKRPLKKKTNIDFPDFLSLNAGQKYCRMLQGEHSAIRSTFINVPFVIEIVFLSIYEWPLRQILLYGQKMIQEMSPI